MEKNAIITGARTGIGRSTVERLAKEKVNLWVCTRKWNKEFEEDMAALAERYSVWIKPVYFDLENEIEVKTAIKNIIMEKKKVDILVNNAGIFPPLTSFQMTSIKELRKVFEVNFFSAVMILQSISKVMIKQREGSIVVVSSTASLDTEHGVTAYASSKAALTHISQDIGKELASYGIRVNVVAPGLITTNINYHLDSSIRENMIKKIGLAREGKAEEVANVITFLALEEASYLNGQIIRIDGGM